MFQVKYHCQSLYSQYWFLRFPAPEFQNERFFDGLIRTIGQFHPTFVNAAFLPKRKINIYKFAILAFDSQAACPNAVIR
jgi:hypothetical protein